MAKVWLCSNPQAPCHVHCPITSEDSLCKYLFFPVCNAEITNYSCYDKGKEYAELLMSLLMTAVTYSVFLEYLKGTHLGVEGLVL